MSTLSKVNFTPVSDIMPVHRRDFPVADASLLVPSNAVSLVDGEWLVIGSDGKAIRATDVTTPGAGARNGAKKVRSFPLFAERGRSDIMAMSGKKLPVLFMGQYEFDTRIFDSTAIYSGGAAITYVGQPLKIATITMSGRNFSGIVGHNDIGGADTEPVIGYVTRLPAVNGGQLRFMSGWGS